MTRAAPPFALLLLLLGATAPSRAEAQPQALTVPGYGPAAFVAPEGRGPFPLVVALHGNFDRPEWMCAAWAPIVAGRAILLCPRGVPREDAPGQDRWALPLAHLLLREVEAAKRALAARVGDRLDPGPEVWVGFSQGAHRLSRLATDAPERFPRIQLVEGGAAIWREGGAHRYARTAGRASLVCAMGWCEQQGRRTARILERGSAEVLLQRRRAAHHDLATMEPAIREGFEWLIRGDRRFVAR